VTRVTRVTRDTRDTRENGALRIFLYNWPVYVGSWSFALVVLSCVPLLPPPLAWLAVVGSSTSVAWTIVSLLVSFYVYDRSALVSGLWVPGVFDPATSGWASVHAGLDAEIELDAVMPGRCIARLDIFDRRLMTSPSIRRARRRTALAKEASPCSPAALALADEGCQAVVVAFSAHEIRDPRALEVFFHELRRSLRPGGRVLIVEHLRDLANFLVFGPGYLHFVPRREWLRLARHAGLTVASETRITPWVMALTLEKPR
jgi:SAM-dependent methyltransferase